MAENHKRDQQRVPEDQMKERVDIVNPELAEYNWPGNVRKIDPTGMNIDQTIDLLLKL
jgi:transcriptional regulator with PAS, ATPase and Fis domain